MSGEGVGGKGWGGCGRVCKRKVWAGKSVGEEGVGGEGKGSSDAREVGGGKVCIEGMVI